MNIPLFQTSTLSVDEFLYEVIQNVRTNQYPFGISLNLSSMKLEPINLQQIQQISKYVKILELDLSFNADITILEVTDKTKQPLSLNVQSLILISNINSYQAIKYNFTDLRHLDLSLNDMNEQTLKYINQKFSSLRTLKLSNCNLKNQTLKLLQFNRFTQLQVLDLSNNFIDITNDMFLVNQVLRDVNLNGVMISDFPKIHSIQKLNVSNTQIYFNQLFNQEYPNLKELIFVSNDVLSLTDDEKQHIIEKFPQISYVQTYEGDHATMATGENKFKQQVVFIE